MVLIFFNFLSIICHARPRERSNVVRVIINVTIGLGFALVALITLNDDYTMKFLCTPWILPTICLVFFFMLVINSLPSSRASLSKLRHKNLGPRCQ